jgi:hypothetical protein
MAPELAKLRHGINDKMYDGELDDFEKGINRMGAYVLRQLAVLEAALAAMDTDKHSVVVPLALRVALQQVQADVDAALMARDTELAAELLNRERRLIERIGLEWAAAMDTGRPSREALEAALEQHYESAVDYGRIEPSLAGLNAVGLDATDILFKSANLVIAARREVMRLAGYGEGE